MQQNTPSIYIVGAGESITLEISAIGVANLSTFAVDGVGIKSIPGSIPRTFEPFTVTVGPGLAHFGRVEVRFPDDAPDNARYQLFLTGSLGGGRFTGPDIRPEDITKAVVLDFRR